MDEFQELIDFLKSRRIDTRKIEEDKIDCKVITMLSDDELKEYIPAYGDRISTRDFINRKVSPSSGEKKRKSLLQRIRKRLQPSKKRLLKSTNSDSPSSSEEDSFNASQKRKNEGNKHATKPLRRIEVGWIMDEKGKKIVRGQTGGGTRHLDVPKNTTIENLEKIAINLFFPNGLSPRGSIDEFETSVLDFKHQIVDKELTVEDVYDRSKLRLLRFYLCTKGKIEKNTLPETKLSLTTKEVQSDSESDSLPSLEITSKKKQEKKTSDSASKDFTEPFNTSSQNDHRYSLCSVYTNDSNFDDLMLFLSNLQTSDDEIHFGPIFDNDINSAEITLPLVGADPNTVIPVEDVTVTCIMTGTKLIEKQVKDNLTTITNSCNAPRVLDTRTSSTAPHVLETRTSSTAPRVLETRTSSTAPHVLETRTSSTAPHVLETRTSSTAPRVLETRTSSTAPRVLETRTSSTAPRVLETRTSSTAPHVLETRTSSTAPHVLETRTSSNAPHLLETRRSSNAPPVLNISVHRGNVLKEVMKAFEDPSVMDATSINISMILPNGMEEAGVGDGVFRDCLTEFWTEFFDKCCTGNQHKVPSIRHDFQELEWASIARVLFKGWQIANYFPISISPIVIECALYGTHSSDLLTNFLLFVANEDGKLFEDATKDFESVNFDDLLDALEVYGCRSIVTKQNFQQILIEIAHKEMVQKCKYITEIWSKVLSDLGTFLTFDTLTRTYDIMEPTARKVSKMFYNFDNDRLSSMEREVMNHLLRYVREIDKTMLRKFLRFCTGSDLILGESSKICVEFVSLDGLLRRPVAHTCGKVLQLPRSYESYTVFRAEFNSILNSSVWVMDIV